MDDNYCRLCMAEDDLNQMDSTVLTCIKNELFVEIENNDELSREICKTCLTFVSEVINFQEKVNHFKEKVNKTQKLLQKIVKRKDVKDADVSNQSVCHPVIDSLQSPSSSSSPLYRMIKNTPAAYPVEKYSKSTPSPISTVVSNPVKETSHPAPAEIDIENLTDANLENELISKIIKSINLDEIEENAAKIRITKDNNWCEVCKIKIVDNSKYTRHLNSNSHKFKAYIVAKFGESNIFDRYLIGYTCQICKKVFTSKAILSDHSRNQHRISVNKNKVKPNTLIQKTKSDDLKKDGNECELHIKEVKEEPDTENSNPMKTHRCKICPKTFGFKESLMKHMKKHHKAHYCTHCGFASVSNRTFSAHLRDHYNLTHPQRLCSVCFKVCESYTDLRQHRKQVHDVKPVCSICFESFSTTTLLKKHKRDRHRAQNVEPSTKKVLKCRRCNRAFLSLLVLEKHQCTAMKFPCLKNCGKRFDSYSKMERHSLKCNSGTTIYSCKNCTKTLKTLRNLQAHALKCPAIPSAPSASTDSKNSFTDSESIKRNEQTAKISVGCSPIQENKISSVSKNHVIDSTENRTDKKMKTDTTKELTHLSDFTCTRCNQAVSVDDLNDHIKNCTEITMKTTDRSKLAEKKTTELEIRLVEKKRARKHKTSRRKKEKVKLKFVDEKDIQTSSIGCKVCGLVFKNDEFLTQHELIAHRLSADAVAQSSTKKLVVNKFSLSSGSSDRTALMKKEQKKSYEHQSPSKNCVAALITSSEQAPTKIRQIRFHEPKTSQNQSVENRSDVSLKNEQPENRSHGPEISEPEISEPKTPQKQSFENRPSHMPENLEKSTISSAAAASGQKEFSNVSYSRFSKFDQFHRRPNESYYKSRQKPYEEYDRHFSNRSSHRQENRTSYRPIYTSSESSRRQSYSENRTHRQHYDTAFDNRIYRLKNDNKSENQSPSATSTRTLLKPEYSKKNEQITITANRTSVCRICRNPQAHMFCDSCMQCFTQNQVQYLNHMKMKHS